MSNVANGLFGPGIFGTGIDLSALDNDTAYRLGIFFGEQLEAARAAGFADGWREAIDTLRRIELDRFGLRPADTEEAISP